MSMGSRKPTTGFIKMRWQPPCAGETRGPSAFRRSGINALLQNKVCGRIARLGEALQERVTGDAAEPEGKAR